jgi:aspartate aminotransferase
MPTLSDRALSLQESAIRKLDATAVARTGVRFHRLNIGQPDLATPLPMMEAIAGFRPAVLAYGPSSGTPACRAAAADWHATSAGPLSPGQVAVTTGGSEALLFALLVVCDPGDEIIAPEPYYTNYNSFCTKAGVKLVPVRTRLETGFSPPSTEELDAAWSPRTRAILFSNPGNPTGAVWDEEALAGLVAWAVSKDIFVIADEVYRRIWFGRPVPTALAIPGAEQHVLAVDSLSKTWSACGLRLGLLISRNAELMEKVERLGQARLGPQPLAQAAAIAAFALPDSYYEELRSTWGERVQVLYEAVSAIPGVRTHKPEGAFYLMASLPVDDTERFARYLVETFEDAGESVMVAPGPGFFASPAHGRDLVRLAAVLEPALLRRAGELLGIALSRYPGRISTP